MPDLKTRVHNAFSKSSYTQKNKVMYWRGGGKEKKSENILPDSVIVRNKVSTGNGIFEKKESAQKERRKTA